MARSTNPSNSAPVSRDAITWTSSARNQALGAAIVHHRVNAGEQQRIVGPARAPKGERRKGVGVDLKVVVAQRVCKRGLGADFPVNQTHDNSNSSVRENSNWQNKKSPSHNIDGAYPEHHHTLNRANLHVADHRVGVPSSLNAGALIHRIGQQRMKNTG